MITDKERDIKEEALAIVDEAIMKLSELKTDLEAELDKESQEHFESDKILVEQLVDAYETDLLGGLNHWEVSFIANVRHYCLKRGQQITYRQRKKAKEILNKNNVKVTDDGPAKGLNDRQLVTALEDIDEDRLSEKELAFIMDISVWVRRKKIKMTDGQREWAENIVEKYRGQG